MARPKLYEDGVSLTIRLPRQLSDDLKAASEKYGFSKNQLAVLGITNVVKGYEDAREVGTRMVLEKHVPLESHSATPAYPFSQENCTHKHQQVGKRCGGCGRPPR